MHYGYDHSEKLEVRIAKVHCPPNSRSMLNCSIAALVTTVTACGRSASASLRAGLHSGGVQIEVNKYVEVPRGLAMTHAAILRHC